MEGNIPRPRPRGATVPPFQHNGAELVKERSAGYTFLPSDHQVPDGGEQSHLATHWVRIPAKDRLAGGHSLSPHRHKLSIVSEGPVDSDERDKQYLETADSISNTVNDVSTPRNHHVKPPLPHRRRPPLVTGYSSPTGTSSSLQSLYRDERSIYSPELFALVDEGGYPRFDQPRAMEGFNEILRSSLSAPQTPPTTRKEPCSLSAPQTPPSIRKEPSSRLERFRNEYHQALLLFAKARVDPTAEDAVSNHSIAIAQFQACLDLCKPANVSAKVHYNIGVLYLYLPAPLGPDFIAAAKYFGDCVRKDPDMISAWFGWGEALLREGSEIYHARGKFARVVAMMDEDDLIKWQCPGLDVTIYRQDAYINRELCSKVMERRVQVLKLGDKILGPRDVQEKVDGEPDREKGLWLGCAVFELGAVSGELTAGEKGGRRRAKSGVARWTDRMRAMSLGKKGTKGKEKEKEKEKEKAEGDFAELGGEERAMRRAFEEMRQ